MVTIRLTRRGATNTPFYHVVVTDSRKRQGGKSLENVEFYDPRARGNAPSLRLDIPRIDHWLKEGAQQSERVEHLVKAYRVQQAAAGTVAEAAPAAEAAAETPAKSPKGKGKAAKGKGASA